MISKVASDVFSRSDSKLLLRSITQANLTSMWMARNKRDWLHYTVQGDVRPTATENIRTRFKNCMCLTCGKMQTTQII